MLWIYTCCNSMPYCHDAVSAKGSMSAANRLGDWTLHHMSTTKTGLRSPAMMYSPFQRKILVAQATMIGPLLFDATAQSTMLYVCWSPQPLFITAVVCHGKLTSLSMQHHILILPAQTTKPITISFLTRVPCMP